MLLPYQAFVCRLAHVQPVDGVRWTPEASKILKTLVNLNAGYKY